MAVRVEILPLVFARPAKNVMLVISPIVIASGIKFMKQSKRRDASSPNPFVLLDDLKTNCTIYFRIFRQDSVTYNISFIVHAMDGGYINKHTHTHTQNMAHIYAQLAQVPLYILPFSVFFFFLTFTSSSKTTISAFYHSH